MNYFNKKMPSFFSDKPDKNNEEFYNDGYLSPEEIEVENKIKEDYNKKLENFNLFLTNEFVKFDYKVNNCLLNNCYSNIYKPEQEMKVCQEKCLKGFTKLNTFISFSMNKFNDKFNVCLEKAQNRNNDILSESIKCYEEMTLNFSNLKQIIHNEFNFYE